MINTQFTNEVELLYLAYNFYKEESKYSSHGSTQPGSVKTIFLNNITLSALLSINRWMPSLDVKDLLSRMIFTNTILRRTKRYVTVFYKVKSSINGRLKVVEVVPELDGQDFTYDKEIGPILPASVTKYGIRIKGVGHKSAVLFENFKDPYFERVAQTTEFTRDEIFRLYKDVFNRLPNLQEYLRRNSSIAICQKIKTQSFYGRHLSHDLSSQMVHFHKLTV